MGINWTATMQEYGYLLSIALILFFSKTFGLLVRKCGFPQVLGAILAGLILGPLCLGWVTDTQGNLFKYLAEIGVIMILFSAGIETNVKDIKHNGIPSIVITVLGVVFPVGLGFIVAACFNGGFSNMTGELALHNMFYGIILAATSVSITVETLKELGKLKGRVGNSIVAAAILDDVIGIIILAVILSFKGDDVSVGRVFLNFVYFTIAAFALGVICYFFFKWMERKKHLTRRLPIFSLVMCFGFSFIAELFGIADITGAYIAGLILSSFELSSEYVERKIDTNSYMFFSPIFFAYIGISISVTDFSLTMLWFGIALVIVGLISKIIGCGLGAKMCGYSNIDSLRVGLGMMARGEVALIIAQKGVDYGLIESSYMSVIILLIVISSVLTPILLKLTYRKDVLLVPPSDNSNMTDNLNVHDALDGAPIISRRNAINHGLVKNKKLKLSNKYESIGNEIKLSENKSEVTALGENSEVKNESTQDISESKDFISNDRLRNSSSEINLGSNSSSISSGSENGNNISKSNMTSNNKGTSKQKE